MEFTVKEQRVLKSPKENNETVQINDKSNIKPLTCPSCQYNNKFNRVKIKSLALEKQGICLEV